MAAKAQRPAEREAGLFERSIFLDRQLYSSCERAAKEIVSEKLGRCCHACRDAIAAAGCQPYRPRFASGEETMRPSRGDHLGLSISRSSQMQIDLPSGRKQGKNARTTATPSCRSAATPSSAQRHVNSALIALTTVSKRKRVANNLEHLRAIHADIAAMKLDISDIKQRMRVRLSSAKVKVSLAIMSSEIAALNSRFDRFDGRLARIEQRL